MALLVLGVAGRAIMNVQEQIRNASGPEQVEEQDFQLAYNDMGLCKHPFALKKMDIHRFLEVSIHDGIVDQAISILCSK